MGLDQMDYLDSDGLANGIRRPFSSQDNESDILAPDELGVATVEVVAAVGVDDGVKRMKVRFPKL